MHAWSQVLSGVGMPGPRSFLGVGMPGPRSFQGVYMPGPRSLPGVPGTGGSVYQRGWAYQRGVYQRGVIPEGVGIPEGGIPGQGWVYIPPTRQTWDLGTVGKRVVRILLECFLVLILRSMRYTGSL